MTAIAATHLLALYDTFPLSQTACPYADGLAVLPLTYFPALDLTCVDLHKKVMLLSLTAHVSLTLLRAR